MRQGTSPRPRPSPFLCVSPILRPLNTTIRHAVGEYTRGRHVGACATQFRFSVVPRMRSAEGRRADFVSPSLNVPLPVERQTRCISGPMHQCRANVTKNVFTLLGTITSTTGMRRHVPLPAPLASSNISSSVSIKTIDLRHSQTYDHSWSCRVSVVLSRAISITGIIIRFKFSLSV